MPARLIQTNTAPFKKVDVDPVTLDIIENAMRNARTEMDAVLFRTAMSPGIREQHDAFPMIANADGKMVVGQFGSFFWGFQQGYDGEIEEGDVFLTNDPYSCNGAISHLNDWLTMMPIYIDGRIVAWAAMFGHMTDIGGKVPGSLPTDAAQIFEEGIQIPPVKIYRKGKLNEEILELILRNCRLPDWNRSDFNAVVAALRLAERRVHEMAERFGVDELAAAMDRDARPQQAGDERDPPDGDPGIAPLFRGLHRRRRPRHGALQGCLHHVARGREGDLRFRGHRSAVDQLGELSPQRGDVQDVPRLLLHQHFRPADPVQRRLLRPGRRAHSARHHPEADPAGRALFAHPHAGAHLRHHERPARPGLAGSPVRRRLLRQSALHVFGLRQVRRVVPALPDRLRRACRAGRRATGRTAIPCGRPSPTCPTSSSKPISRCAS